MASLATSQDRVKEYGGDPTTWWVRGYVAGVVSVDGGGVGPWVRWIRWTEYSSGDRRHVVLNDLKSATQFALRRPGFSTVAAITLAMGIAANVTVFALVRSVLLTAEPYRAPRVADRTLLRS